MSALCPSPPLPAATGRLGRAGLQTSELRARRLQKVLRGPATVGSRNAGLPQTCRDQLAPRCFSSSSAVGLGNARRRTTINLHQLQRCPSRLPCPCSYVPGCVITRHPGVANGRQIGAQASAGEGRRFRRNLHPQGTGTNGNAQPPACLHASHYIGHFRAQKRWGGDEAALWAGCVGTSTRKFCDKRRCACAFELAALASTPHAIPACSARREQHSFARM